MTHMKAVTSDDNWFEESRFGIFIHWGLYSIWGRGEWAMFRECISPEQYNKLGDDFDPEHFDADEWVTLAKRAGAGYVVFTARHHDGFALFESAASEFNSVKTAARRDFVREFVEACRRHSLRVGLYCSVMSWQFPACLSGPQKDPEGWEAMVRQTHEHVRELMTNYGQIDMLWYDGAAVPGAEAPLIVQRFWRSKELNSMVRQLQPAILINDRAALPEDFSTPEQSVEAPARGRRWEACLTMNRSWGYNPSDTDFKPVKELIRYLVRCASHGGNFLLNIGPAADGSVPQESVERLEAIGAWMRVNGESVRNSIRTPFSEASHVLAPATVTKDHVYFHLFDWQGGDAMVVGIDGIHSKAQILGGPAIEIEKRGAGAWVAQDIPVISTSKSGGPAVLRLDCSPGLTEMAPAKVLGEEAPEVKLDSNAPVLAVTPVSHEPDLGPINPASALRASLGEGCHARLVAGGEWCPGWAGSQLLVPEGGSMLAWHVNVPTDGCFDIDLGMLAKDSVRVRLLIDGELCTQSPRLRYGGYPDTVTFAKQTLRQGRHQLCLETDPKVPFGLYAWRMSPVWRPLPSELWQTIGPFPTAWNPHAPLLQVKLALQKQTPPELCFDPEQTYSGADGMALRWSSSERRDGVMADRGVDFSSRCGINATGVCLARTVIESPVDREIQLLIGCDWWANATLNGSLIQSARPASETSEDGARFSTRKPVPATIGLRQGTNTLMIKCHPGSTGNGFTCSVNDPGDLSYNPPAAGMI